MKNIKKGINGIIINFLSEREGTESRQKENKPNSLSPKKVKNALLEIYHATSIPIKSFKVDQL